MSSSVYEVDRIDARATKDRHTKNVRFKEQQVGSDVVKDMDMSFDPNLSRKDQILGKGFSNLKKKPSLPFQLMDIENGYYLEKFQDKRDFEKVISQGPWVTYGQYLIVQPWIKNFNMGFASVKFPCIFCEDNMEHKSDIVGLLEPRMSGAIAADSITTKLAFQCSHRVEVIGYSSGIWLGWKDLIWVDLKQKLLWEALKSSIPSKSNPWVAIGDFNVILSINDKKSRRCIRRICPFFEEFVDSAELHDLGFKGPSFTWQRCGILERLDRAIAVDFFQKLYGDVSEPMSDLPTNSFSRLIVSNIEFLGKEVFNEEIKKALFDLTHLKAS
ncbi:hypothetical protein Goshw_021855, partial [Gossypium schwendimanii]|nr:hypothetical protein [Gossypium schwendimanii]